MQPHASTLVTLGIPGLTLLVTAVLGFMIAKAAGRRALGWYALGSVLWLGFSALLGISGFLSDFESTPPRFMFLVVPTFGLALSLAFSRTGKLLGQLPVAALVLFHGFRLPLELLMNQAAREGTMPIQMSFSGSNFDILTGTTALIVGALALGGHAPRWLLLAWNTLGTALLVNILIIALASLPRFQAFGAEPARLNTWVAYFPFVWLPAGLVCAAVLGHAILWRRLLSHGMRGRALEALS